MKAFEFDKKVEFEVSANQLHKLISRLKSSIYNIDISAFDIDLKSYDLSKINALTYDIDELVDIYENSFINRYKDYKLKYEYGNDLKSLKQKLFCFNVNSTVSEKLSKIEILQEQINYYKIFKDDFTSKTNVEKSILNIKEYFKNSNDDIENIRVELCFYDINEVKKRLNSARVQLVNLESEVSFINSNHNITIEIFPSSAELLGLR